jgi:hypothetical protein
MPLFVVVKVNMEDRMMDIINMKVNFMEVDKEISKEGEIIEVVKFIEVNNQTSIQTAITQETWAHGEELLSKET